MVTRDGNTERKGEVWSREMRTSEKQQSRERRKARGVCSIILLPLHTSCTSDHTAERRRGWEGVMKRGRREERMRWLVAVEAWSRRESRRRKMADSCSENTWGARTSSDRFSVYANHCILHESDFARF